MNNLLRPVHQPFLLRLQPEIKAVNFKPFAMLPDKVFECSTSASKEQSTCGNDSKILFSFKKEGFNKNLIVLRKE